MYVIIHIYLYIIIVFVFQTQREYSLPEVLSPIDLLLQNGQTSLSLALPFNKY